MKKKVTITLSAILVCMLLLGGFKVYKSCRALIPESTDNRHYENVEKRAHAAMKIIKRHDLNRNYFLFVDYSIPSGTPRLFVWSFNENKVVAVTYVMHGPGMGSTAEKPVFSNKPGSNCSSLGRFIVTREHGSKLKRSYRLKGLDIDNQTAYLRGLNQIKL